MSLKAVLEGRGDFYFAPLPLALPEVRASKLKILAVSLPRRSLAVPTAPTMIESGYRNFTLSAWVSVLAPPNTAGCRGRGTADLLSHGHRPSPSPVRPVF